MEISYFGCRYSAHLQKAKTFETSLLEYRIIYKIRIIVITCFNKLAGIVVFIAFLRFGVVIRTRIARVRRLCDIHWPCTELMTYKVGKIANDPNDQACLIDRSNLKIPTLERALDKYFAHPTTSLILLAVA